MFFFSDPTKMSQSRASRTSRVTARESQGRASLQESNPAPRGQSGKSFPAENTIQSRMSNRSPAAISRTPSADRRLLRTLTVSPNTGEYKDDDEDDAVPETQNSTRQPTQARQSTRMSVNRTPTESLGGSPNRMSKTPSVQNGRTTIGLPSPRMEARGVRDLYIPVT